MSKRYVEALKKAEQWRKEKDPASAGWSRWHLIHDKDSKSGSPVSRIKRTRNLNGKIEAQNYPQELIKRNYLSEESRLRLVDQLNKNYQSDRERVYEEYKFRHTFITEKMIEEFSETFKAGVTSRDHGTWMVKALRHGLSWFINQLGKNDPIDWKRNQHKWGMALTRRLEELDKKEQKDLKMFDEPPSPGSIRKYTQIFNQFLAWLHSNYPETIPGIIMTPVSKAVMRSYEAWYQSRPEYIGGCYVHPEDWKIIEDELIESIKPYAILQWDLGLRRREAMALTTDDLWEDHVVINKQLDSIPKGIKKTRPPKGKEKSRIVHLWLTTADRIYEQIEKMTTMGATHYSNLWASEMVRIEAKHSGKGKRKFTDYSPHDLRRTFVTRAIRAGHLPTDVQEAVGHEELSTTLGIYKQDDRVASKKKFVPNRKKA